MNLAHDHYLRTISLVTQILCCSITTICLVLRLIAALWIKRTVNVEDAFCTLSWVLFFTYCICTIMYLHYGGGKPVALLTPFQTRLVYKYYYVLTVIYAPMVLTVKITLLSILARIFTVRQVQIISIDVVLAVTVTYYTIIFFIKVFICLPVSYFWTHYDQEDQCLDKAAVILADAVMSIATDLAIILLPAFLTISLNLSHIKKIKVSLMMGCGGMAIGFSIYRLVLVIREHEDLESTLVYLKILLSGNAEGGFALICSCIPAIHLLATQRRRRNSQRSIASMGELLRPSFPPPPAIEFAGPASHHAQAHVTSTAQRASLVVPELQDRAASEAASDSNHCVREVLLSRRSERVHVPGWRDDSQGSSSET
ncbi:uncharacterized protein BP01DRAFT_388473 [Aspergillus saccharolyticus JOP 1030-1]|uniref:Rhodopsin domain-containing protein n=1 Tax=Aspergillus saccharolyticus JOP 1030-1 TaxID=1450539 RepID=A0A319ACX2_9EURO|nr:hypothetical protein BP01DRAFT_388473 [Aspergillus saccharolyticus JOP 1030-1]PYH49438.1 hypothetical protein BP01DRAFT_388473 [Aspergillus saccharolyticus JOP 1030-1]